MSFISLNGNFRDSILTLEVSLWVLFLFMIIFEIRFSIFEVSYSFIFAFFTFEIRGSRLEEGHSFLFFPLYRSRFKNNECLLCLPLFEVALSFIHLSFFPTFEIRDSMKLFPSFPFPSFKIRDSRFEIRGSISILFSFWCLLILSQTTSKSEYRISKIKAKEKQQKQTSNI